MTVPPRKSLARVAIFVGVLVLSAVLGAVLRGNPKAEIETRAPAQESRRGWWGVLGLTAFGGVATLVVAGVVATLFVSLGFYNVSALSQDRPTTFRAIHFVATRSISTRAKRLKAPTRGAQDVQRGLLLFDRECALCHAAPGEPPAAFSEGMNPNPPPLVQTGRDWSVEEIYWTIDHGVHMTGMPAFAYRLPEADIWAIAAFLKEMPNLSVAQYKTLREQTKANPPPVPPEPAGHAPDPKRGRIALAQYNCNGCHLIPGLGASDESNLGPSLAGVGARAYIAGTLDNTPSNLAEFIMHPRTLRPNAAMPDMRVSESDADDMAAYLGGLRTP